MHCDRFTTAFIIVITLISAACSSSSTSGAATPAAHDRVYVADEDDGTISVIDGQDQSLTATIALPADGEMYMPHNVQAAPDGRSIWVAAPPMTPGGNERVFVFDPLDPKKIESVVLGKELHVAHVVLNTDSTLAYVTANEGGTVIEIDAAKRAVTRSFDLGAASGPHGMRWCAGKLYVALMDGKALAIIDPATSKVSSVDLGGVAVQTACTPDERFVFVSLYDTKEVVRYDLASGALTRIALPSEAQGPVQLYPSPSSTELWVCDQGVLLNRPPSNQVYRIEVASATVTGAVSVGQAAHGIVISDDGKLAYVTNQKDDTVSVVDTAALSVVATVSVGKKPNGIAHWHVTGGMP